MPTVEVNPFVVNGKHFCQVHNAIFDVVLRECAGNEFKLLMYVFRRTVGVYPNPPATALITDQEIKDEAGILDRKTQRRVAQKLVERGFLIWEHVDGESEGIFGLNYDCMVEWTPPEPQGRSSLVDGKDALKDGRNARNSREKLPSKTGDPKGESPVATRGPYHGEENLEPHETREKTCVKTGGDADSVMGTNGPQAAPPLSEKNAPPEPPPLDERDAWFTNLVEVCRLDTGEMQTGDGYSRRIGQIREKLRQRGAKPEDLIAFGQWWQEVFMRNGTPPELSQVLPNWRRFEEDRPKLKDRSPPSTAEREAKRQQEQDRFSAENRAYIERKKQELLAAGELARPP